MNIVKTSVAALALTAAVSAYAQDAEKVATEQAEAAAAEAVPVQNVRSYGWTAVAFGLATPLQLPWGWNKWDVFGLDFNVLLSEAPLMYGIQFGALGNITERELLGWGFGGLFNWSKGEVYGVRSSLGLNYSKGTVYGLEIGSIGFHNDIVGLDVELASCIQDNITGMNVSILGSWSSVKSHGLTVGCFNYADKAYGMQLGFAYNQTDELHGCQIGLVNYARECPWGFQVGLVNIILDNKIKVLPLVNCYF